MANVSRSLEREGLRFFDNLEDARADLGIVDLVFASSSLQYTSDPLENLRSIISLRPRYIFITRTPFSNLPQQVSTVQPSLLSSNGPGPLPDGWSDRLVNYPITFVPKKAVEELLSEQYLVRFRTREGKASVSSSNEKVDYLGFFCERRS